MNKFITILSLLILSFSGSLSFGDGELKLTKEEFLKKVIEGQITMQKDPLFPVSDSNREKLMAHFHSKYPSFKDAYWFVPTLRTNDYQYTLFFEWPTRNCLYRVEGIDRSTRQIIKSTMDPKGTAVDIKYCEKAYGQKIF